MESAARRTRSAVLRETRPLSFPDRTSEAVAVDTPAAAATSTRVVIALLPGSQARRAAGPAETIMPRDRRYVNRLTSILPYHSPALLVAVADRPPPITVTGVPARPRACADLQAPRAPEPLGVGGAQARPAA